MKFPYKKIHCRMRGCIDCYHLKSSNEIYCYAFINKAGDTLSFGLGNKVPFLSYIHPPTHKRTLTQSKGDAERLGSFGSPTKATKSVFVSFRVRRQ